ncbi:MAG TPA: shikimate dehydrogenase [Nitrososphaeraceae archaeon]|jgi:shikimate dehydrogenase
MRQGFNTYCIIGDPIDHSLSPALHNAAFKSLNLDATYIAYKVPKDELAIAVASLKSVNISGFNVTMPHKVEILNFIDKRDASVEKAGAANTVTNYNGELQAFNTDIVGFINPLQKRKVDFSGMVVLLLGAGGAARAILAALGEVKGISKVYISSRNEIKLNHLINTGNEIGLECISTNNNEINALSKSSDLIINATPVGMNREPSLIDYRNISEKCIIYDIVYNPLITPLITNARKANAIVIYGYEMLLEQASESFKIWTGIIPPIETMKKVLFGGIGEPES